MSINLREVPEEALLYELKRRQEIKELKPKLRPMEEIIKDINTEAIKEFMLGVLYQHDKNRHKDMDNKQFVFEMVMELFFTKDVWDWWNEVD